MRVLPQEPLDVERPKISGDFARRASDPHELSLALSVRTRRDLVIAVGARLSFVDDGRHGTSARTSASSRGHDWLEVRCKEFWPKTPHDQMRGTIADIWAEEAPALMPVSRPFDGFVEYTKRVTPTCLVHLERNRYSVPASFANRPVSLRVYPDRVVVAAEGQIVCEHRRVIDRSHDRPGQTIYDWRHYLAVVNESPALFATVHRSSSFLKPSGPCSNTCSRSQAATGRWSKSWHSFSSTTKQAVLSAVDMALKSGVPTKTHVLNLLHRLVDGKSFNPPTLDAPQALTLTNEPKANVERYDTSRETEVRHAS